MSKILHILNGDALSPKLEALSVKGDFAIWREMLCEGKTVADLSSDDFRQARIDFFEKEYPEQSGNYDGIFGSQLGIIADAQKYEEIVLWFEYDLFCHINMLACISFLKTLNYSGKTYLVCSGWVDGETQLRGLAELSTGELVKHYTNKQLLSNKDLFLADDLWRLYCGNDHTKWDPKRTQGSNFKYLSNCISAHKERFPEALTGLNTLEMNLLKLIRKYAIKSTHQLCGYMLNYQGYYGYGDLQILKIIERMSPFFKITKDHLTLNQKGNNILDQNNVSNNKVHDQFVFGGVLKCDYVYNSKNHQLTKI